MKKLSVMSLEEQQFNDRQLSEVLGGYVDRNDTRYCNCYPYVEEYFSNTGDMWRSSPPNPGGGGGGKKPIEPEVDW